MRISDYINDSKKRLWTRRLVGAPVLEQNQKGRNKRRTVVPPAGTFITLRQEDFLNEITPSAHDINSKYMSKRPIYKDTGIKDANGKTKWELVGYDDVETVALGIQECIIGKKISHFAGDGFWNEGAGEYCGAEGSGAAADDAGAAPTLPRSAPQFVQNLVPATIFLPQIGQVTISLMS